MICLGLDPSMRGFGWCVHDSEARGPARVVARGVFKTSPKQIFVARYMFLREKVGELFDAYPSVEAVGVESPPFGELWSEGLYGLFLYVNEAIYVRRADVVYFDPVTVKSLVKVDPSVVKGKMSKSDMVDAARADTGITGRFNHNEADAYHIARFAARFWLFQKGSLVEADLSSAELHTFARTHTYKRGRFAGRTIRKGTVYRENDRFFQFSTLE